MIMIMIMIMIIIIIIINNYSPNRRGSRGGETGEFSSPFF